MYCYPNKYIFFSNNKEQRLNVRALVNEVETKHVGIGVAGVTRIRTYAHDSTEKEVSRLHGVPRQLSYRHRCVCGGRYDYVEFVVHGR